MDHEWQHFSLRTAGTRSGAGVALLCRGPGFTAGCESPAALIKNMAGHQIVAQLGKRKAATPFSRSKVHHATTAECALQHQGPHHAGQPRPQNRVYPGAVPVRTGAEAMPSCNRVFSPIPLSSCFHCQSVCGRAAANCKIMESGRKCVRAKQTGVSFQFPVK